MKHVISRCAVASSADDVIITALDAVYWTRSDWQAVTQSAIRNTFQTAGFNFPDTQDTFAGVANADNSSGDEILHDDVSAALNDIATLLVHVKVGGRSLTPNEFVEVEIEIPAFNEWNDDDNLITIDADPSNDVSKSNEDEDEDDMPTETPPNLVEVMEMVRQLRLLANTQHPRLHSLVSQLDSQLTQLFIDSKGAKQTTIGDFFRNIE